MLEKVIGCVKGSDRGGSEGVKGGLRPFLPPVNDDEPVSSDRG